MSPAFDAPRTRTQSVARPRLLAVLATDETHASLTIVHGSAGSGKSTLLTQWAHSRVWHDDDLVWVTLYPDDAGAAPFWTRIAHTLARAEVVPAVFGPPGTAVEFPALLGAMLDERRRPLTLVLDDYHLVAHERIDEQLRTLLTRVEAFSLVIATRSTNALQSIETAARFGTRYVDAAALAFTLEESEDLVAVGGLAAYPDLGRDIHRATGGWPLASQAFIIEANRDAQSPLLQRASIGTSVFAKELARTTLTALPNDARPFVLKLSFSDETTVALASELTGEPPEATVLFLAMLEHEGIGTWQTRSGADWFRLHPLLRETLEAEALLQLDEQSIRGVRGTLGEHLAKTRPLRALELLITIEDWGRAEHLILLRWVTLSFYHRVAFTALLSRVPASAMRAHPGILNVHLVEEYNILTADRERLVHGLTVSASLEVGPIDPTVVGALREFSFSGAHRLAGDMPRTMLRTQRALASLASADPATVVASAGPLLPLRTLIAVSHYFDRQDLRGISEIVAATASAESVGTAGELLLASGSTAFMNAMNGEVREAQSWIEHGERMAPYDGWVGGYLQAPHLIARAAVAANNWDTAGALASLDILKTSTPGLEFWPWMLHIRAYVDAIIAGPATAHALLVATLAQAKHRPPPVARAQSLITAAEAQLLLLSGQPSRAHAVIEASGLAGAPEVDLVRARLASASRQDALALDLALSVVWSSPESPALRAEALLTLAACAYESAQHERAVDAFTEALAVMRGTGLRLPLLWLGPARARQLSELAATHGAVVDTAVLDGLPAIARQDRSILPLTASETRVLAAVHTNGTVPAAAGALFLSPETVRFHLKQVYRKLGVRGRAEAITLARELGLIDRAH